MELSELRQRWQQAAAAPEPPAGLDETALRQLLSRGASTSPVAKMERNMWLEIAFVVFVTISCGVGLLVVEHSFGRAWMLLLLLVCVLSVPYYVRKRQLIGRLRDPHGSVREHVQRQVAGMRALMKLYYRLTMWTIPVWMGLGVLLTAQQMPGTPGTSVWIGYSILGGFYLLYGTFMYFLMRRFTRWYMQKLYGQHLDQLEASLAELEEPALN